MINCSCCRGSCSLLPAYITIPPSAHAGRQTMGFQEGLPFATAAFRPPVGMDNHGTLPGARRTLRLSCFRHAVDRVAGGVDASDCRQFGAAFLGSLLSSPIPILLTCLWPTNLPVSTTQARLTLKRVQIYISICLLVIFLTYANLNSGRLASAY